MADAKIEVKVGAVSFTGEGSEEPAVDTAG